MSLWRGGLWASQWRAINDEGDDSGGSASIIGVALVDDTVQGGSFVWIDEAGNEITKPDTAWFDAHPAFQLTDEVIDGQHMVRVPKSYWHRDRITVGSYGACECWWISDQPATDFHVFKAFELSGSEVDQFWYGKYEGCVTSGKLESLPGVTPTASRSWDEFQGDALARNTGGVTGFRQIHTDMRTAIQWLYLIENGSFDSQATTAEGNVNSGSTYVTDHADNAAASYRGIYALWGNLAEWIDGLRHFSGAIERCGYDGVWVGTGETPPTDDVMYVNSFKTSAAVEDLFLGDTYQASETGALVPDYQRFDSTGTRVALVGGLRNAGGNAGLWYINVVNESSLTSANVGSRLARVV